MLKFFCSILLALFIAAYTSSSAAAWSLGTWQATGSQTWRITFPANGASKLYYPHSGRYLIGTFKKNLSRRTTLHVEAGYTGKQRTATGSDSDWDYSQKNDLWYYGEFKTAGAGGFLNIDWEKNAGPDKKIYCGYSFNRNTYRMTDGTYFIENYEKLNPPTALPLLNSTYAITYQGPHIGVAGLSPLSPSLKFLWSVTYSPLALVQGHGWWNLRGLNFIHTGLGQLWDGKIGLQLAPPGLKNSGFTIGYRYQYFGIYGGAEDTSPAINWQQAINIRKGFYATSEFHF